MAERWLTVAEAADGFFSGKVMRVYRRIWRGDIAASNAALDGDKPSWRIAESSIQNYFESRRVAIPSRHGT